MAVPEDLSSMLVDLHAIFNIFSRKRGFPTNEHKGVIIIRISQKNRQHNGQKKKDKRTNNDLQNIHIKLKIE
jgi:hypothetical protein